MIKAPGRGRLQGVSLLVLALLLAYLLKLWDAGKQPVPKLLRPSAQQATNQPDIYLSGLEIREFTAAGALASTTQAPAAQHYPDEGLTRIDAPQVALKRQNIPAWFVQANHALVRDNDGFIELREKVVMRREFDNLMITTNSLLWKDEEQLLYTPDQVTVTAPPGIIRATGFQAYINAERYQLLSEVTGEYHNQP